MTAPERILVRLPNWLGDAVMARPLVHALAASFPGAEVRAWGPRPLLELLASDGAWGAAEVWSRDPDERRAAVSRLRAWRADVAVVLPPSFSSAWWAWRAGARVRIGFRAEGRTPLLTHATARPERGDAHLSDEYLALARVAGAAAGASVPVLATSAAGRVAAAARVGSAAAPYAVLGPGAIYGPAKRWPAERFAAVGRELVARGMDVWVCGAAADRPACEAVAAAVGPRARTVAGETELAELAALCAGAAVVVCNDSGLAHVAAAVGAPTVAVFGSTSSAWTAPRGPRVRVVQHAPVCSPCFRRTCRVGYRCLVDVGADEVVRACAAFAAVAA